MVTLKCGTKHPWVSSTPVGKRLTLHTRSTSDFLPGGEAHLPDGHYDLFALSLNTPSRWVEVAWASERRTRWARRAWERANSIIPWGLGGRQPPPPPDPRLAKHHAPVIIELKPGTIPVRKCQYPLPVEAWASILPHINRLKQAGTLVECQSAWNTPILPVKKEEGQDYRPVEDLRLVN